MKTLYVFALMTAVVLITGCKNRLVFVTQTSAGLDISGTANYPNKVSFSYSRYEGAIVPRKTAGSNQSHSVYGGMDSDVKFALPPKYRIDQVFATGEAAALAAKRITELSSGGREETTADRGGGNGRKTESRTDTAPLVFLTSTTLGIHFTAGEQELNPTALVGYRRREATVIPIVDSAKEARSVYADIHLSSRELDAAKSDAASGDEPDAAVRRELAEENGVSQWGGVRIKQSFATGHAAETLAAGDSQVRAKLDAAAGLQATDRNLKRLKLRAEGLAEEIFTELDRLEDEQLNAALNAFRAVGFISDDEVRGNRELAPRAKCRKLKGWVKSQLKGDRVAKETVRELEDYLARLRGIN